jgi:hypothetical protein
VTVIDTPGWLASFAQGAEYSNAKVPDVLRISTALSKVHARRSSLLLARSEIVFEAAKWRLEKTMTCLQREHQSSALARSVLVKSSPLKSKGRPVTFDNA